MNKEDSKYFIKWLISNFKPAEYDQLAQELLTYGYEYGASKSKIDGGKLLLWAGTLKNQKNIIPKWAYLSALDLALSKGWKPTNETETEILAYCESFRCHRDPDNG